MAIRQLCYYLYYLDSNNNKVFSSSLVSKLQCSHLGFPAIFLWHLHCLFPINTQISIIC